jgi:hypothetical protein
MIAAFTNIEDWLKGWPSGLLTVVLLLAAAVLVYIAFTATPLQKAVACAYVVFP